MARFSSAGLRSASFFLLMHGPTKTTRMSFPKVSRSSRQWAMSGEPTGVMFDARRGMYLRI